MKEIRNLARILEPTGDSTAVWAYGLVEPGWYVAAWIWNEDYANHLQSLGYRTERSVKEPQTM